MKIIKELEADGSKGDSYRNGYNQARKDVLELINELDKDNMGVIIKEELKARITG